MENKKPDLTNFKNIFNYVVYGLAGIVSVLWLRSTFKEDNLVESLEKQVEKCDEENEQYRNDNRQLIFQAYNLRKDSVKKTEMLEKSAEVFDSMAVQNLKQKASPILKNIKHLTK